MTKLLFILNVLFILKSIALSLVTLDFKGKTKGSGRHISAEYPLEEEVKIELGFRLEVSGLNILALASHFLLKRSLMFTHNFKYILKIY